MTTLAFTPDPVDEAVLALLGAITNLPVHIGSVGDSDANAKTVSAPLPYLLYGSTLGFSTSPRLGGHRDRTVTFTATYTHDSLRGVKAVALAVRDLLDGVSVSIAGRARRISLDSPDRDIYVTKDQTWSRPGGRPLFFAVDRYNVSI